MVGESCIVRTFMWLETWLCTSYVSLYYDLCIFSFVLRIKGISSSKISIQSNVRRKLKNPAASTNDTRQHCVGSDDFVSGQVDFDNIDDVIYSGRISLSNIKAIYMYIRTYIYIYMLLINTGSLSPRCAYIVHWYVDQYLTTIFFGKWVLKPSASVLKSWNPRWFFSIFPRRGVFPQLLSWWNDVVASIRRRQPSNMWNPSGRGARWGPHGSVLIL